MSTVLVPRAKKKRLNKPKVAKAFRVQFRDGCPHPKIGPAALYREISSIRVGLKRKLKPRDIVDAARDPTSKLHLLFTWDNKKAAERYRRIEAGRLLRVLIVTNGVESSPVYVSIKEKSHGYCETAEMASNDARRQILLERLVAEVRFTQRRFESITSLADAQDALRRCVADLERLKTGT